MEPDRRCVRQGRGVGLRAWSTASPAGPGHCHAVRVYYEDTDAGGVVYHARYLAFAERARTEMLRAAGAGQAELASAHRLAFVVQRIEVEYLRPARLDDALLVHTRVLAAGSASAELEQAVSRDGTALARLRVRLACVGGDGRPARLPARWREALRPGAAAPADGAAGMRTDGTDDAGGLRRNGE